MYARRTSNKQWKQLSKLKKSGTVIRPVMQIVSSLMGQDAYKCEQCGSENFEIEEVAGDFSWGYQVEERKHTKKNKREPPK